MIVLALCSSMRVLPEATAGFVLKINDKTGSIKVDVDSVLNISVSGADPNAAIEVYVDEYPPIPDTLIAQGNADASGNFGDTTTIGKAVWVITAYQKGLIPFTFAKTSNRVKVTAGEPDWMAMILPAAAVLGGLYIAGNILGRR